MTQESAVSNPIASEGPVSTEALGIELAHLILGERSHGIRSPAVLAELAVAQLLLVDREEAGKPGQFAGGELAFKTLLGLLVVLKFQLPI